MKAKHSRKPSGPADVRITNAELKRTLAELRRDDGLRRGTFKIPSKVAAAIGVTHEADIARLERFVPGLLWWFTPGNDRDRQEARELRANLMTLRKALADALRAASAARRALARSYTDKVTPTIPVVTIPGVSETMQLESDLRAMGRLGHVAEGALVQTRRAQGRPGIGKLVELAHALIEEIADLKGTTKSEELAGLRSYKGRGEPLQVFLTLVLQWLAPDASRSSIATAIKRAATAARKAA